MLFSPIIIKGSIYLFNLTSFIIFYGFYFLRKTITQKRTSERTINLKASELCWHLITVFYFVCKSIKEMHIYI